MARLVARSPADGLLPVEIGANRLVEVTPEHITSIKHFPGGAPRIGTAFVAEVDLGWPAPRHCASAAGATVTWAGLDEALVLGPALAPFRGAAVTDQSDAWAVLALEGSEVAAVLARLTPLDLRASHFPPGSAARSLLGHINCLFWCTEAERINMLVFRSMASTAVHEVMRAMESVDAQFHL